MLVQHTSRNIVLNCQRQRKVQAFSRKASKIPTPDEDKEVTHEAFMKAYQQSLPKELQIEGLQEFAGSIWERRRRIPSTVYRDPLQHVFDEFDANGDGRLSADEIAAALQSRKVNISEQQVQKFIDAVDQNANGMVDREEFTEFIFHMASVDQRRRLLAPSFDESEASSGSDQ